MNTIYDVEAHIADLNRDAAQHRLARESRSRHFDRPFIHKGLYNMGTALIWLGSQLTETVCESVKPAVTVNHNATISLSEPACC